MRINCELLWVKVSNQRAKSDLSAHDEGVKAIQSPCCKVENFKLGRTVCISHALFEMAL